MRSYLVQYVEGMVYDHNYDDNLADILDFLENEIIYQTGNYFDELIEIAKLLKHRDDLNITHFRNALKVKILQERDLTSALILIKKFDKE